MTMHEGHRGRMRERFRRDGLEGFAPHEVLELLLFYGRARGDTNPTAHRLLDTFGSLKGVLEAKPEQLMAVQGVGEETATLISLMLPMFRRYSLCLCEERQRFPGVESLKTYCINLQAGRRTEHFYVMGLSTDYRLLGQRLIASGTVTEVSAYPRLVAEAALNFNAYGVVLCHNHPDGLCVPSPEDIRTTRAMSILLSGLGIHLLDHVVVVGEQAYSMHEHGDLSEEPRREKVSLVPEDGRSHLLPEHGTGRRKRKETEP